MSRVGRGPCPFPPGSAGKIAWLAARAASRRPLYHESDAPADSSLDRQALQEVGAPLLPPLPTKPGHRPRPYAQRRYVKSPEYLRRHAERMRAYRARRRAACA